MNRIVKHTKMLVRILLFFCLLSVFYCCRQAKRIAYFQDISDSVKTNSTSLNFASYQAPTVFSGDILKIQILTSESRNSLSSGNLVKSKNEVSNRYGASLESAEDNYVVDNYGEIELQILGKIKVAGLATAAIKESIISISRRYLNNAVITVQFANFPVTVLGEVNKPGGYNLNNEKSSVLDALAAAGDMTIYGKRENVLLLRNDADKKQATRLDLTSSASLKSSYFFLRQGDIIYVEPNKAKMTAMDGNKTRNYALIASGLSVLIILLSRLTF